MEVAFRTTSFMDRRRMAKLYKREEGYLLEELMAAEALVMVDGHSVDNEWDSEPIRRMDNWSMPDVQYYLEAFMTVNSLDETLKARAADEAKKLMGGMKVQHQEPTTRPKGLKVNTGVTIEP
jgi:hypothetical protein